MEKYLNENAEVVEEIKDQDLEGQATGAGAWTAISLTVSGKCGRAFTLSYECTSNNVSCGN